jgi:serine phosphatase RsbU (regulator of sigma subunit)
MWGEWQNDELLYFRMMEMKRNRTRSFFLKIFLLILIPLLIIMISASISFIVYQRSIYFQEFLIRGELLTKQAASLAENPLLEENYFDLIDAIDIIIKEKDVVHVHVMDPGGTIIESSDRKIRKQKTPHTLVNSFTWEELPDENIVHFLYPVLGGAKGFTCVELSKKRMNADMTRIMIMTFVFIAIFIGISLFISYLISRSIMKPIDKLRETFYQVAEGNLSVPIDTSRTDEIGNLARSFAKTRDEIINYIEKLKGKERLEKELEMAATVQRNMLPRELPAISGYDIAADSFMAREVGGDFYDIIVIDDENLMILIGDVSGKGMPAALYMSATLSIIYGIIYEFKHSREAVSSFSLLSMLEILNNVLKSKMQRASFVTLFMGILNIKRNIFRYSSSGHDPVILYNPKTDRYKELKTLGQSCGIVKTGLFKKTLEEKTITINDQDYLIFNTDGVTEAYNKHKNLYKKQFLSNIASIQGKESAKKIITSFIKDIWAFVDEEPQHDDITLLCIKKV